MNWLAQHFELSRGGEAANVRPMEGLRGFAVLLVFLVHYVSLFKVWIQNVSVSMEIANALHTIGNSGVDLFFVLSGFLIYGSLIRRKQPYSQFIYRRVERIYPTFTAVFLIYICLSFVFRSERKIPVDLLEAALYLVQNFLLLPGLLSIEPMITVAWSLSYEMFYYLAIPIAIEILRLRERTSNWRKAFFVGVSLLIIGYCAAYGGPIRLVMFISGILLFEAIGLGESGPNPSSYIGLLALTIGLLGTLLPISGSIGYAAKISILFVAFFLLCHTCFHSRSGWLSRSFSWTPLRWLGNMSYSYYLLHGLTLKAAFLIISTLFPKTVFGMWHFWVLLPLMLVVTLLPTSALFIAVERPFSLFPSRKRSNPLGPVPATSSGTE